MRGVVLISPHDRMVALAWHHYSSLPVSGLLRHRFEAIGLAPRTWVSIPGADHDDLGRQEAFWQPIRAFLDTARAGRAAAAAGRGWAPATAADAGQNGGASRPRSPKLSG